MKNFLVLYHAPAEAMAQTAALTPEQQSKGMEAWMAWSQRVGDRLVDMGSPLMNGKELRGNGSENDSTKNVSGYSLLRAESMEEAQSLLEGHPHLGWNDQATIEIHETMPLPGM